MPNIQNKSNETYNRPSSFDNRFSRLKSPKTSTSSSSAITQPGLSETTRNLPSRFILYHSYKKWIGAKKKETSLEISMYDRHRPSRTDKSSITNSTEYYHLHKKVLFKMKQKRYMWLRKPRISVIGMAVVLGKEDVFQSRCQCLYLCEG
jgi:hypothetical protein